MPAGSTALAQYFAAVLVPPRRRSDTSTDSQRRYFGKQAEVILCPSNSAEVRFQRWEASGKLSATSAPPTVLKEMVGLLLAHENESLFGESLVSSISPIREC